MIRDNFETTIEERNNAINFLKSKGHIINKFTDFNTCGQSRTVINITFNGTCSELKTLQLEFDSIFPEPNNNMRPITIEDCKGDHRRLNHYFDITLPKNYIQDLRKGKTFEPKNEYSPANHLKEIAKLTNKVN
jgi:hypothetical protein